jgi:hypothetical protein
MLTPCHVCNRVIEDKDQYARYYCSKFCYTIRKLRSVPDTNKLYFDGGGDTYIQESTDGKITISTGVHIVI